MSEKGSDYNPGNYNKTGFLAFIGSFGFSILLFVVLGYFYTDIQIDEVVEPPAEGTVVKRLDLAAVEKPWLSTDELVAHGQKTYKSNCATCHGNTGKGDGPGSAGMVVRNLIQGEWQKGGTSIALYKTLTNGIEGTSMAGFSHIKPVSRWALVHYVRSITKNKVEDDAAELEAFANKGQ